MKLRAAILLLTISFGSFALGSSRFLWTHKPQKETEEVEVIEMIKWRQPVCLMPAEGVSSCMEDLKKYQKEYESYSSKEIDQEPMKSSIKLRTSFLLEEESKPGLLEIVSSLPENHRPPSPVEEFLAKETPELRLNYPKLRDDIRESRRLIPTGDKVKTQQIHVTKVLIAPTTATLVAYGCIPDIGIPLCQNRQPNVQPSMPASASKPSLTTPVAEKPVIGYEKPAGVYEGSAGSSCVHQTGNIVSNKPSESIQNQNQGKSEAEFVIRPPTNEELSTRFKLEGVSSSRATPGVEEITEVHNTGNVLPSKINFIEKPSHNPVNDRSMTAEVSLEPLKEYGKEGLRIFGVQENPEVAKGNSSNKIFETIRGIMDNVGKSKIVQTIQSIFDRSDEKLETSKSADGSSSLSELGNSTKSENQLQNKEDNGTTVKSEISTGHGEDKMDKVPSIVKPLIKPVLDVFELAGMKSTKSPSLFDELFNRSKGAIEVEGEKKEEVEGGKPLA